MAISKPNSCLAIGAALAALLSAPAVAKDVHATNETPVERFYCTQFGPFFLRFDPDKAAGVFAILRNKDLGSVVGALSGRTLEGEWAEVDSRGEIRIAFSDDWATFDAEYTIHHTPDEWRGGWTGRLAPDARPHSFDADGQTFYCR